MIEQLFSKVQPDVVSLQTLSRFPEYEMLPRLLDLALLDSSFVEAALKAKAGGPENASSRPASGVSP